MQLSAIVRLRRIAATIADDEVADLLDDDRDELVNAAGEVDDVVRRMRAMLYVARDDLRTALLAAANYKAQVESYRGALHAARDEALAARQEARAERGRIALLIGAQR